MRNLVQIKTCYGLQTFVLVDGALMELEDYLRTQEAIREAIQKAIEEIQQSQKPLELAQKLWPVS
jgi:hypothetical protein